MVLCLTLRGHQRRGGRSRRCGAYTPFHGQPRYVHADPSPRMSQHVSNPGFANFAQRWMNEVVNAKASVQARHKKTFKFIQEVVDAPQGLLTPMDYGELYFLFMRQCRFNSLVDYSRKDRLIALETLGLCAFKAVRTKVASGGYPAKHWTDFAHDGLRGLGAVQERRETMLDILGSALPDLYKMRAVHHDDLLADWLDPNIRQQLLPLLPEKEHACLPYLPWGKDPQLNMQVAVAYCPELGAMLSGVAPASVWEDRAEMLRYVQAITPKKESITIGLPANVFDEHSPS